MHFYFEDLSLSSLTQNEPTKDQQHLKPDLIYVHIVFLLKVKHHLSKAANIKTTRKVVFIPLGGGLVSTTIDCFGHIFNPFFLRITEDHHGFFVIEQVVV